LDARILDFGLRKSPYRVVSEVGNVTSIKLIGIRGARD
jgi:hypothetical protein